MKIGIFQDVHANLPALKKGIEVFQKAGCTKIFHVGDLIAIGPYPKECLDLALSTPEMEFIMGNHDYWYAFGLPDPIPDWMSREEAAHQKWTHEQIGDKHRKEVQDWVFSKDLEMGNGKKITFRHYGLNREKNWFKPFLKDPDLGGLEQLFEDVDSEMVFYGHDHEACDIQGRSRYVNLGSSGCYNIPVVRLGVLDLTGGGLKLEKMAVRYDDGELMETFEKRQVPARDFIKKVFIFR